MSSSSSDTPTDTGSRRRMASNEQSSREPSQAQESSMLMVPTASQIAALTNVGLLAIWCGLSGGAWNALVAEIGYELDDPIRVIASTTDKEAKTCVANVRTFKNDSGEEVAVKPAVAGKFRLFFATARHTSAG